ncbi:hypothetical protein [Streptococcus sp. S784/96/1]|uniref:hypothetical protein n=1 Tax=Streptococcus sp. S784/96/1 TaxID=2653499 RepID=UPI001386CF09|nr:hypothetical protein [Streptococcus sp. S784/96/1]
MTKKQDDFSYKTENTRFADNYPLIDVRYPLAMFYKKTLGMKRTPYNGQYKKYYTVLIRRFFSHG